VRLRARLRSTSAMAPQTKNTTKLVQYNTFDQSANALTAKRAKNAAASNRKASSARETGRMSRRLSGIGAGVKRRSNGSAACPRTHVLMDATGTLELPPTNLVPFWYEQADCREIAR
jgi:hypothetical protein